MCKCKWCNRDLTGDTASNKANHHRWCKSNPRQSNGDEEHTALLAGSRISRTKRQRCIEIITFIPCKQCNNIFQITSRGAISMSKALTRCYCSPKCQGLAYSSNHQSKVNYCKCGKMARPGRKTCSSECHKVILSRPKTDEHKLNLSIIAKSRKFGGYVENSGKKSAKKGWYKGIFCDSSWELAFVVYHLDHGNSIVRNTEKFEYTWCNQTRRYMPDFILNGGLVEIKGMMYEQDKAKIAACSKPLQVLREADLSTIFEYVKAKYGKDFTNLYELRE